MTTMVHSVPLSAKTFTEKDLEISKKYICPDVYPGLYQESELPKGVKYIDRRIMAIKDILLDVEDEFDIKKQFTKLNLMQTMLIRQYGRGSNADDVFASLSSQGFKLDKIPMSVAKCPDNKDYIQNGRTRLEKLMQEGFTHVIVDYYTCSSWDSFAKMAQITNFVEDPYSPHTKGDIITHCNHAIKMGYIKREYNDIRDRILEIAPNSFKPATINKMTLNVLQGDGHTSAVLAFTEKTAKDWLKTFGYHDNVNNNGIYYKVLSTQFHSKALTIAARYLCNDLAGCNVKELRIVLHTDTLDGADPEVSWKSKIDNFRNKYRNAMSDLREAYYIDPKPRYTIKLFGAIPAVQSLQEQYPMDKLVMFHVGKLKDSTFSEIDTESNLLELFEA